MINVIIISQVTQVVQRESDEIQWDLVLTKLFIYIEQERRRVGHSEVTNSISFGVMSKIWDLLGLYLLIKISLTFFFIISAGCPP